MTQQNVDEWPGIAAAIVVCERACCRAPERLHVLYGFLTGDGAALEQAGADGPERRLRPPRARLRCQG